MDWDAVRASTHDVRLIVVLASPRHWATAAITNVTRALAMVVSQSTGTVRLFQEGEVVLRIAPMRHSRAMKWYDAETKPVIRNEKRA